MTQYEQASYDGALWRIGECRQKGEQGTKLDLTGFRLTTLPPEIGQLTALKELLLLDNQLTALPPEVASLTSLAKLSLAHNKLETLPTEICQLTALTELDLDNNQLTTLPPKIGQLTALTVLHLHNNRLTTLPPEIGQLTALRWLVLRDNKLTSLPTQIGELKQLIWLSLSNNGLQALSDHIGDLTQLKRLSLRNTGLTQLPAWIGRLKLLHRLSIADNKLNSLPLEIRQLNQLTELNLHDNPDLGLPKEVLGPTWEDVITKKDKPKPPLEILDYYFRINDPDAGQPLNEFKLILVGWGGVGKTTLVHRLVEGRFKKFKPTDGIKIRLWPVTVEGTEVRAHVWDFGGQQIMHGTHRFFMTERALYLVLVTARENRQQHDAEYWLSLIRSFAGDVPVIVLLHKKGELPCDVDRRIIRDKYGEDIEFLETDSNLPSTMEELHRKIERMSARLSDLRAAWPKAWHQVKQELPEAKDDWLTYTKFCEFCSARGVPEHKDQEALSKSLNTLGLMLAFRDDPELKNLGVLKPQWVTTGVYKMLTAPAIKEAGAKFTLHDFETILDQTNYPAAVHPFLLGLMEKFKLCFPLDPAHTRFMIPELLPAEEPDLEEEFPASDVLGFAYRYDSVLPQGLLPLFIVETFRYREPEYAWKTGVVLKDDNCRAWVRGDVEGRKIRVRVAGPGNGRRALLAMVRQELRKIHEIFNQLPVTELVPLPGHPEVMVSYEKLLKAERQGRKTVEVEIGDDVKDWPVQELLDGVGRMKLENEAMDDPLRPSPGTTIVVTHDQSIHIVGDVANAQVGQTLKDSTNMTSTEETKT